jgi:predicted DNA-binding transcriptional regulator YafY
VRLPRSHVRYLRDARILENSEHPTVITNFDSLDHALRSLLAYGAQAEVLAPPELRRRIAAEAAATTALYDNSPP